MNRRQHLVLGASSLLPLGAAQAQSDYPNRPIRIVSPTAPGSGGDTLIRRLGGPMSEILGQPIVIENRPGAQGAIGARFVAKAPNDGYTLLLGGSSMAAGVHLMKEPGYDPVKDFTPISLLILNPLLMAVNAELPVRTLQEFIKYAKERPGKLTYGTGNAGSAVSAQLLKTKAGFDALAINYPGMPQATTDLLAGRVDFIMGDVVIVAPHVKSGKLRVLGVTSRQRLPLLPEIVPMGEQGVKDYEWVGWVGLFGPAGMPAEAVRKVNAAAARAINDRAMRVYLAEAGMIPVGSTTEQFRAFVPDVVRRWGGWIKDAGMQPS